MPRLMRQVMLIPIIWLSLLMRIRLKEWLLMRITENRIIANAASGISQLASSLSATGTNVKGFGMQVNDNGTASYFAVLEKSSAAQKERIEKKAAEKKEAKKTAEKKAEKKKNEERLEKKRKETGDVDDTDDTETVTVTASSIEELLEKIKNQEQLFLSDTVRTPQEKNVGQNVDFSV